MYNIAHISPLCHIIYPISAPKYKPPTQGKSPPNPGSHYTTPTPKIPEKWVKLENGLKFERGFCIKKCQNR